MEGGFSLINKCPAKIWTNGRPFSTPTSCRTQRRRSTRPRLTENEQRTCGYSILTANCVRYNRDKLRQQCRRLLIVPNIQHYHQLLTNKVEMTPSSVSHYNIVLYNKCPAKQRPQRCLPRWRNMWILAAQQSIRRTMIKWMRSFTPRN